ncbi:hypothetical protein GK047_08855 [Paenibacillus sp. SYP-B3998]|uniref:Uncharacterized protein n=1 Tax=Paenibacillus sp. SYP-B3998 TaxID=2678564 RepID=A0A6G3ZXH7_9BACL|nr:hypothetical protein [Paenibacillus sp. SYP-B3998]NEW06117.1 hypothetical protein [Paenibacillus sp. SYP-B3998]
MSVEDRVPLRSAKITSATEKDDTYLPPRKVIHSSEQGKWTRIFYLTLFWLFVVLVAGLTVWGIRYS